MTRQSRLVIQPEEAAVMREVLRERGMTLGEFAVKAGIWPSTMSNILNGYTFVSPQRKAQLDAEVKRLQDEPQL